MKIDPKKCNLVPISQLTPGDVFKHNREYYVLASGYEKTDQWPFAGTNLGDGSRNRWMHGAMVTPLPNATLVTNE